MSAFILKPLYILPTYKATRTTIKICNNFFGNRHHGDTRANAFRHALWNYLICENCYRSSNSMENAINWSKKITDLHEDLSLNLKLAKAMDLHNNRIGRELFSGNIQFEDDAIEKLRQMAKASIKISSRQDMNSFKNELVYIED
ncbi:hypothetical protein [Gramella sp. MAR_2010_147]|uniref:DUF6973 domain-containing protein n=1 Tax=Gramella sp. MAR_2010_147 TaxID=1250205 RepID=UPI0012FE4DEE|nr:hypothetical protein [Gramella sp. MAR_2010_147]